MIDDFMDEFDILLKKYSIYDVVLINFDDDEMGYRQLMKITEIDGVRLLVMSYSGKGNILCPCYSCHTMDKEECQEKE